MPQPAAAAAATVVSCGPATDRATAVPRNLLRATMQAVGEPPFHLGASVFFALKEAVYAARK